MHHLPKPAGYGSYQRVTVPSNRLVRWVKRRNRSPNLRRRQCGILWHLVILHRTFLAYNLPANGKQNSLDDAIDLSNVDAGTNMSIKKLPEMLWPMEIRSDSLLICQRVVPKTPFLQEIRSRTLVPVSRNMSNGSGCHPILQTFKGQNELSFVGHPPEATCETVSQQAHYRSKS